MNIKEKYNSKAKDSFKTKLNIFLFHCCIEDGNLGNVSLDSFNKFKIDNNIIKLYTKAWQIEDVNEHIKGISIKKIEDLINNWHKKEEKKLKKQLQDSYTVEFKDNIYPFKDFEGLWNIQECECDYCHLTEKKIKELIQKEQLFKKHYTRGWTFEIDRKEPNKEYTKENTVLCCYWCNNAKTDEFLYDEFKKVGKVFEQIWKDRLLK